MKTANKGLTPKEVAFVENYMIDLNASQAYERAGFKARGHAAQVGAHNLMKKPRIIAAIEAAKAERSERTLIGADNVLRELSRIAFLDIGKAFTEGGQLKPLSEMDEDTRRAITSLEITALHHEGVKVGTLSKLKLADKLRALELLGRHLGIFDQKVTVDAKGDTLSLLVQAVQGSSFTPVVINGGKAD